MWAAAFSALACLDRYPGVGWPLPRSRLLALQPGPTLREKLQRIGVYLMISTGPLALWLLRNYLVTGTLTGPRGVQTNAPVVKYIGGALNSVEAWNPLAADLRALILPFDRTPEWDIGGVFTGVVRLEWLPSWGGGFCAGGRDEAQSRDSRHAHLGRWCLRLRPYGLPSPTCRWATLTDPRIAPMYVPLVVVIMVTAVRC